MRISELSIHRPIFMSCILAAMLVVGSLSISKMPVELFPDVSFPVVTVTTLYPGAGPNEMETLVSKPLEEELGSVSGVKTVRSINLESVSTVVVEFTLETDVKFAEQQVRDRVSTAKRKLPDEIEEPTIRRIDPADQPIMMAAVSAPLEEGKLYDLASEEIRPKLEQIAQVGRVELVGGRKREIQVQLDREKIKAREIPVIQVVQRLKDFGQNVPSGKVSQEQGEIVFRTLGEFNNLEQIQKATVSFLGNDIPTKVSDIGTVVDTLVDEKTRAYLNGQSTIIFQIYKQSGANTVKVANAVKKKLLALDSEMKTQMGEKYDIRLVYDMARFIDANVADVLESIFFGIILTILVVFFFLGSIRSTFITGLAIPFSMIGGLALVYAFGFSINVMTLLAMSLAVGLLIDDAIVVRENIFRHLEMGKSPLRAALEGTAEVRLAVIAVTLAILSVFGPIAFLQGVVGQFFKSFGMTVCFVMAVSLFDALSNAPMLSAYFGGTAADLHKRWKIVMIFDKFQSMLEEKYALFLNWTLRHRILILVSTFVVVMASCSSLMFVPKTFLPAQDNGEFMVSLEMKPGTSLEEMANMALKVDKTIHTHPEITQTILTVGDANGLPNVANFFVALKPFGKRTKSTTTVKMEMRDMLKEYATAAPTVKDVDMVAAGMRPFNVYVRGQDLNDVKKVTDQLYERLKKHPGMLDPELTDKPGRPEFQVKVDLEKANRLGMSTTTVGQELRGYVEGLVPAKFREKGLEYDVRVRMKGDQRDLEKTYNQIYVPNMNMRMIPLNAVADGKLTTGPANINRENRARYIGVGADLAPNGPGMGGVINDINGWFANKEIELPPGVTYRFVGQAENFQELVSSMLMAALLAVIFLYLVLASLYESLMTPLTIMLVIPLGMVGAFVALMITQHSLDLFSMIGCIMLMGLATKNSIILVDYINHKLAEGMKLNEAIVDAGKTRLRPILMTSLALIAGMVPVAIGLNEASNQRTSLGVAVIGGVVSSTLLTLIVIPAVFSYIESFRQWMLKNVGRRLVTQSEEQ